MIFATEQLKSLLQCLYWHLEWMCMNVQIWLAIILLGLLKSSTAARSETDLAKLSARLTGTVQEALQPEQVSLWIKPYQRSQPQ